MIDAVIDIHHHASSLDIVAVAYWRGKGNGGENDSGRKKKRKNESNINEGRVFLPLCCKKGLVGMIIGES